MAVAGTGLVHGLSHFEAPTLISTAPPPLGPPTPTTARPEPEEAPEPEAAPEPVLASPVVEPLPRPVARPRPAPEPVPEPGVGPGAALPRGPHLRPEGSGEPGDLVPGARVGRTRLCAGPPTDEVPAADLDSAASRFTPNGARLYDEGLDARPSMPSRSRTDSRGTRSSCSISRTRKSGSARSRRASPRSTGTGSTRPTRSARRSTGGSARSSAGSRPNARSATPAPVPAPEPPRRRSRRPRRPSPRRSPARARRSGWRAGRRRRARRGVRQRRGGHLREGPRARRRGRPRGLRARRTINNVSLPLAGVGAGVALIGIDARREVLMRVLLPFLGGCLGPWDPAWAPRDTATGSPAPTRTTPTGSTPTRPPGDDPPHGDRRRPRHLRHHLGRRRGVGHRRAGVRRRNAGAQHRARRDRPRRARVLDHRRARRAHRGARHADGADCVHQRGPRGVAASRRLGRARASATRA